MLHHNNIQLTDESRVPGYEALETVLCAAYNQAANGKGKERHAQGDRFLEQPIMEIGRLLKSIDGELYQAIKKVREGLLMARNGEADRAVREFLGAINYIAAATLLVAEQSGENVDFVFAMQEPQIIPVPVENEITQEDIVNAFAEACEIYPRKVKLIGCDELSDISPPEPGEIPMVNQIVAALHFCFGEGEVRRGGAYTKVALAYRHLTASGEAGGYAIRRVVTHAIDKFRNKK